MGSIPAFLLRHTVSVRPYLGQGGSGPLYGAPVTYQCFVEAHRRKVRDSLGEEVISSTTVRGPRGLVAPPKSEVVLPDGSTGYVLQVADHDGGGLPVPSHLELALT